MKDDLVERVLAKLLNWDAAQVALRGNEYQAMASLKYDEYEGYRPGEGFLEHLAAWLGQMDPADRLRAAQFVRDELVFISRAELDHVIETVYPDVIRPLLVAKTSRLTGIPAWEVARLTGTPEFQALHRKTLVLGLGDGARIDRLRRSSDFSHEQFYVAPELSEESRNRMVEKLKSALETAEPALFEQVVLVDDFAGSGYTSIRVKDGVWDGRLERTNEHLVSLEGHALVKQPEVWIVLYVASAQARAWIDKHLRERGLPWKLHIVQQLPDRLPVDDKAILTMCERYFDDANYEVLGSHVRQLEGDVRHGFGNGRLPLVLSHNTPNNSVSILWADTTGRREGGGQRALFPRRHRHNAERP